MEDAEHTALSPECVVDLALREQAKSISFTYTEPTAFYEYAYDISMCAKESGLMTSIVSNGYINPEPLRRLLCVTDAIKIDLKGFTDDFYREVCSATLEPVLASLRVVMEEGVHLEIVNLVVPGLNDAPETIQTMCRWIAEQLTPDVPLHLTRFVPHYKMSHLSSTPISTLERARDIARNAGLTYVYVGNVPGHEANHTYCGRCGTLLIRRAHMAVAENHVAGGRCTFCGESIPGIWA
jgi:pyruvate formate lyase activating enzyme